MIDWCKQFFTFRSDQEEDVKENDYKEFINPMYMKR